MWYDELVPMVRYIIDDVSSSTYSDGRLQTSILIAAKYVNMELFSNSYTINVAASSISPDPTDPNFMNLVALKTACLLSRAEAKTSAGQGIAIRDGSSSLDLKGVSTGKKVMADSYCKAYEDAKTSYITGASDGNGPPGEAILGPIKYWHNSERGIYE